MKGEEEGEIAAEDLIFEEKASSTTPHRVQFQRNSQLQSCSVRSTHYFSSHHITGGRFYQHSARTRLVLPTRHQASKHSGYKFPCAAMKIDAVFLLFTTNYFNVMRCQRQFCLRWTMYRLRRRKKRRLLRDKKMKYTSEQLWAIS